MWPQFLNNLAGLYEDQGRYADAEPRYKRALTIDEEALGRHPQLLHIATHGYFSPSQAKANAEVDDPMLRSSLMFGGADRVLNGELPTNDLGDGVFTAYEASSLDLQGTELVVLSACDTDLGEIKDGEGVFGVQRGSASWVEKAQNSAGNFSLSFSETEPAGSLASSAALFVAPRV